MTTSTDNPSKIFKETTTMSKTTINDVELTIGMRIREKRKEPESYRSIVSIDGANERVAVANAETNRRSYIGFGRLSRYEIHPDDLPSTYNDVPGFVEANTKGGITVNKENNTVSIDPDAPNAPKPKLNTGRHVRKAGTEDWEEIAGYHESSDCYIMKGDSLGVTGTGVSREEVESEDWEKKEMAPRRNSRLFSSTDGNDFLDTKKAEIRERIAELQAQVDEHAQLTAALRALEGRPEPVAGAPRRGRPRGSGTRAGEAIAVITEHPGITAAEIAEKMGIKTNYLYRVLPALENDGKLRKYGRGWYVPTGA